MRAPSRLPSEIVSGRVSARFIGPASLCLSLRGEVGHGGARQVYLWDAEQIEAARLAVMGNGAEIARDQFRVLTLALEEIAESGPGSSQ